MMDLVGCRLVEEQASAPRLPTGVPNRQAIEDVESGFALQEELLTVGVFDAQVVNAKPRVRVRKVACRAREAEAVCRYEASRCLAGEEDGNGDGWCRRQARFVPALELIGGLTVKRGWTIVRTRPGT
jgi:hypothetical protein